MKCEIYFRWHCIHRYPDEEAGEIPMAYVVRKAGSNVSAAEIMDYIGKQVLVKLRFIV